MPQTELHAVTDLETRAMTLPELAPTVIITPADYLDAGEFVKRMDALLVEIGIGYDDNISAAHKLHKDLIAKKNKYAGPPSVARTNVRYLMNKWDQEQERIRREEEMRLETEARRRETEAKIQEAIAAEAAGETEEAEAIMEEEVYVPPVILQKQTPKVQGVRFAVYWKHEVTDFMGLVKAVASGKAPVNALKPDDVFLGNQARALKSGFNIIGVKAYSEKR